MHMEFAVATYAEINLTPLQRSQLGTIIYDLPMLGLVTIRHGEGYEMKGGREEIYTLIDGNITLFCPGDLDEVGMFRGV